MSHKEQKFEEVVTEKRHTFSLDRETFIIDLYINPDDPHAQDDVYSLLNEDGSVHQKRTVKDDGRADDGILTLCFTGLERGQKYSLDVDLGDEGRYFAFYSVPLEDLLETAKDSTNTTSSDTEETLPASSTEISDDDEVVLASNSVTPRENPAAQDDEELRSIHDRQGELII